jgi:hypothetical protein
MRRLLALALVVAGTLSAQAAKTAPAINPLASPSRSIARGTFTTLERRFDGMLKDLGTPNEPVDMLGATRGVYLEGYGVVFTVELSLVLAPTINPFRQSITPEAVVQVYQRKLERLPSLRAAMREMVRIVAMTPVPLPENEQIALVVRLDYLNWENTSKMPVQILMRASRKAALAGEIREEAQ